MAQRKQHSPEFKAKVALRATKELETINELAAQFDLHPSLIRRWKGQLYAGSRRIEHASDLFVDARSNTTTKTEPDAAELYEQNRRGPAVGRLKSAGFRRYGIGVAKKKLAPFHTAASGG